MAQLSDIFKNGALGQFAAPDFRVAHTTPQMIQRTLPNGGGTFAAPTMATAPAPVAPQPAPQIPAEWMKPGGGLYSGKEIVDNMAAQKQGASSPYAIPRYAGNAITNPNQSEVDLNRQAYGLNNARNDIATGTTDPYKVASQSGIAYSPQELRAIEKAYAGIYDPALSDVFTKLDVKAKKDAADLAHKQKLEDIVFSTNESIRQWRQTTGTKAGSDGGLTAAKRLSGAAQAGLSTQVFDTLDEDIQNFFANPVTEKDPDTGKTFYTKAVLRSFVDAANNGDVTPEDARQQIMDSSVSPAVQQYYIDQLPVDSKVKQGWLEQVWNWATGK